MSFNGYNTNTQIPIPSKGMSLVQNDPSYASYLQNIIINSPNQLSVRYGVVLKHKLIPPQGSNIFFGDVKMISNYVTTQGTARTILYQCYYVKVPLIQANEITVNQIQNGINFLIDISRLSAQQKIDIKNKFYIDLKIYIKNLNPDYKPPFFTKISRLTIGENEINFDINDNFDCLDNNNYELLYERALLALLPNQDDIEIEPEVLKNDLDSGVIPGSINYKNTLIIFNGIDPVFSYDGTFKELKSYVPVPRTQDIAKTSNNSILVYFNQAFEAELRECLKVNEWVILSASAGLVRAEFKILAVNFAGTSCTLTLDVTTQPLPLEITKGEVLYRKSLPHFSEVCVVNDRLWGLPEGRSSKDTFRKEGRQMLVYYSNKSKTLDEWFTASGLLPFIQTASNSDSNDNIETIKSWEGRTLFMGRKKIQVWNNADPTENDDARNISISEFALQKIENIGLFHKRAIIELPGILLFLSDTGIGTISIDGFNNLIFNSEISREIWDKTKEQINSIQSESEYRDIRAFKYNYGGFFGFRLNYICYIYQANGIHSWGTFTGSFNDCIAIEQNLVDLNLYLGGNEGELLVYADKRKTRSYLEYKIDSVPWQVGWNWLELQSPVRASRLFVNAFSLGEARINATINFNMNNTANMLSTININQRASLYNLPDVADDGEGIAFLQGNHSNYYCAAIKNSLELLKNSVFTFKSVKLTLEGVTNKGLQFYSVNLVN